MKFFILILISSLLVGCLEPEPFKQRTVEYSVEDYVPDSLIAKKEAFIIAAVKSASYHMTGGDYEDPEDVLSKAEDIAERLYKKHSEGLLYTFYRTRNTNFGSTTFVPFEKLTSEQKKLFNQLKPKTYLNEEK